MLNRLLKVLLLAFLLSACSLPFGNTESVAPSPSLPPPQVATATPFAPEPSPTPILATDTPVPTPTATVPPEGYGPDEFPPGINPLTGMPASEPELLERRPLAVKITLLPRSSRPQWGLSLADMVYEYYQNGGISRFHAIFYGTDAEMVGPIRSARFFDSNLVQMYKSIFAFGSGDARVLNRFSFASFFPYLVSEFPAGCSPMCRIEPNTLNHLVTNTAELSDYISNQGLENGRQDLTGMRFDARIPEGGQTANAVILRFGPQIYHRWDYDQASGRYLRSQDAQDDLNNAGEEFAPMIDRLNDEQISVANPVVLLVPHEYFSRSPEIVEINMAGASGRAYAFRDGQVYELTWSVPNANALPNLQFSDGTIYPLKPGNTWFAVIGTNSTVSEPENADLRFDFRIP